MIDDEDSGPDASGRAFARLVSLMHALRAPGGCPWDAEQTHASIKQYVIEEAYEVLEAIDSGSDDDLCEELGDLLLQVVFHAEMARERTAFSIHDVVDRLSEKLIRRHPHVFSDTVVAGSEEVVQNWARIKADEKAEKSNTPGSALDGVPRALPAALRAHRLGQKAALVGFDWNDAAGVRSKFDEEVRELDAACEGGTPEDIASELGDVLFTAASLSRLLGINAETAMHDALDRFERRFREMERDLRERGQTIEDTSRAELDLAWCRAKLRT